MNEFRSMFSMLMSVGAAPRPPTLLRKPKEAKFEPRLPGCYEGVLVDLQGQNISIGCFTVI